MSYRISNTTFGPHRDTVFTATVTIRDTITDKVKETQISKINVCVAKLADQKWWIIPAHARFESEIEDIGPFEEVEHAIVHLKLVADGAA